MILAATEVYADPSVLVVPEGHPFTGRAEVAVPELAGERMVAPLVTSAARPMFDALFQRQDVQPHVVAEAATEETVLELVRAGVGCTVTFASSAAIVAGRGACAVPVSDHPPNVFQLLTRARQVPTPAAQAFRDFAAELLSG